MSNTLSKEEIWDGRMGLWSVKYPEYLKKSFFDAMDEYAKQEAIAFAKWISYNEYEDCIIPNGWVSANQSNREVYNDEQLYDLYLLHKQNKK